MDEFAPRLAAPSEKLILVIDDDADVRSVIELAVQGEGFQVVTAVNGLDGMAKLAVRAPDLIITDLMMPGLGGYEFMRGLPTADVGRIPVIVITGRVCDSALVSTIREDTNVVEFIVKPIRMPVLFRALHKHLKTVESGATGELG